MRDTPNPHWFAHGLCVPTLHGASGSAETALSARYAASHRTNRGIPSFFVFRLIG